eukprot:scaffold313947_cov25-Prasinocladus_malaysianus.AAC.1
MDEAGAGVGIDVTIRRLPEGASGQEAEAALAELNEKEDVDAIMVEIPIPAGLSYNDLVSRHDSRAIAG